MRIDDLGPRTWLIAGATGWVLLAWVLALAGMGGRVQMLADDPGLLVPLPQGAEAQPALGPADQYQTIAERPLFARDRSPHPFFLEEDADDEPAEGFDYVLTSVLLTPGTRLAIVRKQEGGDPFRVQLDQSLAQSDWRLVELTPRAAVFEGTQGRRSLELTVFDGTGGEPTSAALEAGRAPQPSETRTAREPEAASQPDRQSRPQQRSRAESQPDPARNANDKDQRAPDDESEEAESSSKAPDPAQEQMDSIRQRIEARRAALREDEM